jgi:aminopeptidase-like protein
MRTPHGCFPEYHTSADNLEFISPQSLADSFSKCLSIFNLIETNAAYVNLNPKCEPQLGKRGLYRAIGGQTDAKAGELAILWVLNFSDGNFSLLDIAERSDVGYDKLKNAADLLTEHGLLRPHRPVIAK